jgi:hypothetical protein
MATAPTYDPSTQWATDQRLAAVKAQAQGQSGAWADPVGDPNFWNGMFGSIPVSTYVDNRPFIPNSLLVISYIPAPWGSDWYPQPPVEPFSL